MQAVRLPQSPAPRSEPAAETQQRRHCGPDIAQGKSVRDRRRKDCTRQRQAIDQDRCLQHIIGRKGNLDDVVHGDSQPDRDACFYLTLGIAHSKYSRATALARSTSWTRCSSSHLHQRARTIRAIDQ